MLEKRRFSLRENSFQQKDRDLGYKQRQRSKGENPPPERMGEEQGVSCSCQWTLCTCMFSLSPTDGLISRERLRFPDKKRLCTKFLCLFFVKQNFLPHHWNPFTCLALRTSDESSPCWSYWHFSSGDNAIRMTTPVMSKGLFIGTYLDSGRSGAFNTLWDWQLTLLPFLEVFSLYHFHEPSALLL